MSAVDASGTLTLGGNIEVHRLGYGAMRITGQGVWDPPRDSDRAKDVLRRVVELGIDLIDTADSYGPHVSEELIAEALHPYPPELTIATKGGLERTGRATRARAPARGLRVDRIDVYQLHSPDRAVPYVESVGALKQLRDEGKIRHVGVSNVNLEQLAQAVSAGELERLAAAA